MDEKITTVLDSASEVYLWLTIEGLGGFVWRMNHDLADGRIDSTPGIEKDLIDMRENIEYAVGQLTRFGIEDPKGKGRDKYGEWYKMWKEYTESLSDTDYQKLNDMLAENESNPCPEFSPYPSKEEMSFGKKLKKLRLEQKIGLRKMSEDAKITASELNQIENGYAPHPNSDIFGNILLTLGLVKLEDEYGELMELYKKPFVMQKMPEFLPLIHATVNIEPDDPRKTRAATADELADITIWLQESDEEHNKKADAYNKEHGVV